MARINGTELSDILIGTAENDIILGYGGNDSLSGLSGNDHLNGGSGSDELAGGAGHDVYKVDVFVGDEVIVTDLLGVFSNFGIVLELLGDTVRVEVNLDGQIQILTVAIAQIQPRDQVGENAGEGRDRVVTNVSYVLPANVENLTLTGRHPTNGTGNVAANVITGNSAANTINGDAGNDVLRGMTGWDTLIGGEGADRVNGGIGADDMRGGAGNDTYRVDNSGDSVQEAASAGIDRVISTISFVLPENVEHLTLLQTAPLSGTGNGLNNAIVGNGGANVIDGLGGDDWIDGRVGNDTLNGGPGNDLIRAGFGADRVNGGPGNDRLTGDTGPDTFVFGQRAERPVQCRSNHRLRGCPRHNRAGSDGLCRLDPRHLVSRCVSHRDCRSGRGGPHHLRQRDRQDLLRRGWKRPRSAVAVRAGERRNPAHQRRFPDRGIRS